MGSKRTANRADEEPRRTKGNTAGENASKKTRADVPATPANRAASGKIGYKKRQGQ